MASRHWFDRFNIALSHRLPRRQTLRAAGALSLLGLAALDQPEAAARTRRCQKRRCKNAFRTKSDIRFCQIKCGRCQKARTTFCIISREDPKHPKRSQALATCCHKGDECCGEGCCRSDRCCNTPIGKVCLPEGAECCPEDFAFGICLSGQTCCEDGCVDGDACPCPDGLPRCNGTCCPRLQSGQRTACFGGTMCCPDDYVEPFWCPGQEPILGVVCQPDSSRVCCDGHFANVGATDPTAWVCFRRGPRGYVLPASTGCNPLDESYPPLATRTAGQG